MSAPSIRSLPALPVVVRSAVMLGTAAATGIAVKLAAIVWFACTFVNV